MKNARLLLACAAASVLAACGSQPLAPPASRADDESLAPPACDSGSVLVFVTRPDGTVSAECRQNGSGS